MQAKAKKGLLQRVKDTWSNLSFTTRGDIKTATTLASVAGLLCFPVIAVTATMPVLVTAGLSFLWFGLTFSTKGSTGISTLIRELRHGRDETTWKNMAGQTIKSTIAEKRDLQAADHGEIIMQAPADGGVHTPARRVFSKTLMSSEDLLKKFQQAADKVTVVKDIENGNGKYRFNPPLKAFGK